MTEFEILSAIKNYVTSNEGVTNFAASDKQIREEVDTARIRLLAEQDIQHRFILPLDEYLQKIVVDTVYDQAKGKRVATIPTIYIRENGKPAVRYVGSTVYDHEAQHKVVAGVRRLWAKHDLYTGNMQTAYYDGTTIEFDRTAPTKVLIEAVFNDPSKVRPWGYNWKEDDYPVPQEMADILIGKTSESYIRASFRYPHKSNTQADVQPAPSQ